MNWNTFSLLLPSQLFLTIIVIDLRMALVMLDAMMNRLICLWLVMLYTMMKRFIDLWLMMLYAMMNRFIDLWLMILMMLDGKLWLRFFYWLLLRLEVTLC